MTVRLYLRRDGFRVPLEHETGSAAPPEEIRLRAFKPPPDLFSLIRRGHDEALATPLDVKEVEVVFRREPSTLPVPAYREVS